MPVPSSLRSYKVENGESETRAWGNIDVNDTRARLYKKDTAGTFFANERRERLRLTKTAKNVPAAVNECVAKR
ncbi:MAG: hypothetical protein GY822_05430 [Deltaproteobacteria bacterium]|nr:hypothetical protein [Deltaproteobacteria bacterium]